MGSTSLQCLAILHECLDAIGVNSTGKTLIRRLNTLNHRNCHEVLHKVCIDVQHSFGFFHGLLAGGVRSVTFLPQELSRAQEQTRAHLPTNHISPLVAQNRQVTVRLNPILISVPNNGFGSRTDNEFLFQLSFRINDHSAAIGIILQTIMCHNGTFLGKALHMAGFTTEKGLGNKNREIGVRMPRLLEHPIQSGLHLLPNRIAVWFYHHTSSNRRILSKICFLYNIIIPL